MSQPEKILFDNRIKRKNVLALNEKVAAIREFEKTPVYKHVGRSFNCSPDQIKRIIQQKNEILKAWEQRTRRCNEVKSLEMKSVRVSMLGKSVYEWIRRMMYYKDFIITDGLIQKMALQFKSALGIQVFFPHQDWCDKFRTMYKITQKDTKNLKIAYTQGYSVQIKDIIRDILIPEHAGDADSTKNAQNESNASDKEDFDYHGKEEPSDEDDDDDDDDDDSNYGEEEDEEEEKKKKERMRVRNKYTPKSTHKQNTKCRAPMKKTKQSTPATPTPTLTTLPQRHLLAVKLPLGTAQNNGAKLPQQVLVATPIAPGPNGHGHGAPPMTMTIIPLASVAQTLNAAKTQSPSDKPVVPPPKVEIKREIEDDEEPILTIKKEYLSDEEGEAGDVPMANNAPNAIRNFDEQEKENAPGTASPLVVPHKEEIESMDVGELSEEEEDNLALAQLQKGLVNKLQNNNNSSHINSNCNISNNNNDTHVTAPKLWPASNSSPPPPLPSPSLSNLPAMPPLTRAPTSSVSSTSSNKRRHATYDRSPPLPAISTCAEARKYLKLLEDFALVKENFRLIGLITRADEVLRELDGDDDVDVV